MSRNALALVDCSSREQLYQFLMEHFDRKATKNEMISPYDEQLIGKMNFRYGGMEHAMFFTYARSSEYPGMRFHNHKIIYLSLGVNEISSDIFQQICSRFGGFIDYDDDLELDWQKIERQNLLEEHWPEAVTAETIEKEKNNSKKQEQQTSRQISKPEAKDVQQDNASENRNGEKRESRRKDGRAERRHREKSEQNKENNKETSKEGGKEDRNRGQRHERTEINRTENKNYNRSRSSERNGQKRFAKKVVDKQVKTVGNGE